MRFYDECALVAESIGALFSEKQRKQFALCAAEELWQYQPSLGMWIRHHLLPHRPYLHNALMALGLTTPEEMAAYLITFAHQYWKLKYADLL